VRPVASSLVYDHDTEENGTANSVDVLASSSEI